MDRLPQYGSGQWHSGHLRGMLQWFIAPTDLAGNSPDVSKAPHVINNSWGCPPSEGCTDVNVLKTIVENVQAAGILVVVSAGNDGSACSSVLDPAAIYDVVLSVGATDGASTTDAIASFSSRGPVTVDGSSRMKPDVSAPGVNVRSSTRTSDTSYGASSGTSMAGPHVAGAAALLMSARPELIGNPTPSNVRSCALPYGAQRPPRPPSAAACRRGPQQHLRLGPHRRQGGLRRRTRRHAQRR